MYSIEEFEEKLNIYGLGGLELETGVRRLPVNTRQQPLWSQKGKLVKGKAKKARKNGGWSRKNLVPPCML